MDERVEIAFNPSASRRLLFLTRRRLASVNSRMARRWIWKELFSVDSLFLQAAGLPQLDRTLSHAIESNRKSDPIKPNRKSNSI